MPIIPHASGERKRLRIAILGTRGLPARYGGRETAAEEIGKRLVRFGHEVTVLGRNGNSEPPRPASIWGIRLLHLPALPWKGLDSFSHLLISTVWVLCTRSSDVVVLSDIGTGIVAPLLELAGIRTVWWVDGPAWERKKWGWAARSYLRFAARTGVASASIVISDSEVVRRFLSKRYGCESSYVGYGAELRIVPGRGTLDRFALEPERYVLFVGRLTPEKGVHVLLEAYREIDTELPLVIVGDNPYDPEYVQSLHVKGGGRAIFTGYQFEDAFHELMQNCQIYVQPSEIEGTSPVVLSAMAYGRATIVSGIAANRETVADAALTFLANDAADLRTKLGALLGDPNLRAELGRKGRMRVEQRYSWEVVAEEFAAQCIAAAERGNEVHTLGVGAEES